nr:ACP S-malonyltransferase [Synergistaceae bacterium]
MISNYALVYPGQGSQKVGMGLELYKAFKSAKDVFDEADDALNFKLSKLIFEGSDDELTLTQNAQPAIMTVSIAVLNALKAEFNINFDDVKFMAGHSLGEYTALAADKVLKFADAVRLVNKRGKFMQEAVKPGVGAMAAVMGLSAEDIKAICAEASQNSDVQAANFNSPGQVVISGLKEYVDKAVELAKLKGAKKAVMLNVSAPFHSKLMINAADRLKEEFAKLEWHDANCDIIANYTARPVRKAEDIRNALYNQTFSPVLWEDSIIYMNAQGVSEFVELGAGNVLSGLIKRCVKGKLSARDVKNSPLSSQDTPESLEALAKALSEA